jgi:hypothetical protein
MKTNSVFQTGCFRNTEANEAGQQTVDIVPLGLIWTEKSRINRENRLNYRAEPSTTRSNLGNTERAVQDTPSSLIVDSPIGDSRLLLGPSRLAQRHPL